MSKPVEIIKDAKILRIQILHRRIDGENYILNALLEGDYFSSEVSLVELDFENVEYLNSLGITEFINIHRKFNASNPESVEFKFINVDAHIYGILELVEMHKIAEIILKKSEG